MRGESATSVSAYLNWTQFNVLERRHWLPREDSGERLFDSEYGRPFPLLINASSVHLAAI